MGTDGLLRLLIWLSPAFPTGGFAYSHGLEWAVEAGDVTGEATALAWIGDALVHGAGRNDAILLRHAHAACTDGGALGRIAEVASATALGRERQTETLAQGAAFVRAAAVWDGARDPAAYPVTVGALTGRHGIDADATAAAFVQAFAANLVSAAVRLVPLGQTAGLRVLAALEPAIQAVVADSRDAALDDLGGCAWRAEMAAMRHETQHTRLFRS